MNLRKQSIVYLAALLVGGLSVFAGTASADTNGVLGVTQITAIKTLAAADGTYANGWSWVFDVTVPTTETTLNMKFADWVSGSSVITAGDHIRIYSAQSSNAADAAHAITISAANSYSGEMDLIPTSDLSANAGRQIQITVEAAVPVGSAGGSYSTGYGIQSNLDITAPVITLTGVNPQTIERTSSYIELGATALDNVDGVVAVTSDASAVDTNTVGTYTVNYSATDSTEHTATTTRTVNVNDTVAPVITIADYNTDPTNADITVNASTNEGTLNANSNIFTENGAFTFIATDAAGNSTSQTVTITNIDKVAPVITVDPYNTDPTNQDITVTATTDKGTLNADSHLFTENDGFTFVATDAAGNVTSQLVTITNIDKVAPVITIADYNTDPTNADITVNASTNEGTLNANSNTFTENGAFAFIATDAVGNSTSQTVTITNIDKTAPTAEVSYSTTDLTNQDVVATITPSETVVGDLTHTFTANGTYTFNFTDLAGNAGSVEATVSNIDTEIPTLNVTGFTANGTTAMDLVAGAYVLNTDGSASTNNTIQFTTGSVASEALKAETIGLVLQPTAGQTDALVAYYAATKAAPYLDYLDAAAAGTQPFAYIKTDGTSIQILDGAMKTLASTESDMIVPNDFPAGNYTVKGTIHDLAGNSTEVTYVLSVVAPAPADTTLPTAVASISGDTITYTFSEPVQLVSQADGTVTALDKSLLGIYAIDTSGNYGPTTVVDGVTIESATLDASNVLTIKYTDTLLAGSYVVDAWGYSITDLAGNRIAKDDLAQVFTIN